MIEIKLVINWSPELLRTVIDRHVSVIDASNTSTVTRHRQRLSTRKSSDTKARFVSLYWQFDLVNPPRSWKVDQLWLCRRCWCFWRCVWARPAHMNIRRFHSAPSPGAKKFARWTKLSRCPIWSGCFWRWRTPWTVEFDCSLTNRVWSCNRGTHHSGKSSTPLNCRRTATWRLPGFVPVRLSTDTSGKWKRPVRFMWTTCTAATQTAEQWSHLSRRSKERWLPVEQLEAVAALSSEQECTIWKRASISVKKTPGWL